VNALAKLRGDLGAPGLVAIALMALAFAAHLQLVRPMESRVAMLKAELAARAAAPQADRLKPAGAAAKLAAFYEFFRRDEAPVDWLAKLYGTAGATGIELRQADYRLLGTQGQLDRYQVTLPVAAPYPRIRAFIDAALLELPVLSLDQVAFRRKRAADATVEADLVFTLHVPRR